MLPWLESGNCDYWQSDMSACVKQVIPSIVPKIKQFFCEKCCLRWKWLSHCVIKSHHTNTIPLHFDKLSLDKLIAEVCSELPLSAKQLLTSTTARRSDCDIAEVCSSMSVNSVDHVCIWCDVWCVMCDVWCDYATRQPFYTSNHIFHKRTILLLFAAKSGSLAVPNYCRAEDILHVIRCSHVIFTTSG